MHFRRFLSTTVQELASTKIALPKKITKAKGSGTNPHFFVDYKNVRLQAGKGGDGMISFLHVRGKKFGGPDGGDGGHGAHVIFQGDNHIKSLNRIPVVIRADDGEKGYNFHMTGKCAEHLVVKVPVGTQFTSLTGELVCELTAHNMKFIAARGGSGGKGNHYFLTNDNKRPMQFEYGHKGEEKELFLELKMLADVALIGYPNAGKSSLLNAITRANSKIGDYAFTTRFPQLGIIEYEDDVQLSVADLPGFLPDLTRGFGVRFFRHVEKCKILVFVVDLAPPHDPVQQLKDAERVLNVYKQGLLKEKRVVVVGSKIDVDLEQGSGNFERLREYASEYPCVAFSAEKRINVTKLITFLRGIYNELTTTND